MKLLLQAFKILSKFRLYFAINLIGLILSLTCGMIIIRYIHQELTVDHYIKDLDRMYLTIREFQNQPPSLGGTIDHNNDPNHINVLEEGVESHTIFYLPSETNIIIDEQHYNVISIIADTTFLQLLPHPIKTGNIKFEKPNDAIITDRLAKRLFGEDDPLGKTFVYNESSDILTVTGVVTAPRTKSSFHFDLLVNSALKTNWSTMDYAIVKLHPSTDVNQLNEKYSEFRTLIYYGGVSNRLQFFPLKDFYMDTVINIFNSQNDKSILQGNARNITILSVVVVLLLAIGFFNYANIYTVLMLNRAREFGVKKVYGAGRKSIFGQIWAENLLLTLLALLFVWAIIEISKGVMESQFAIPVRSNPIFDIGLSVFVLLIFPVLISIHPAMKYNNAPPIVSLRSVNIAGNSVIPRIVFLSLQYIITFFIVVVSLFFMKQLHYMLDTDIGYETKNIISTHSFTLNSSSEISYEEYNRRREKAKSIDQVLRQKIKESPSFESYSRGDYLHLLTPYFTFRKEGGEFQQAALAQLSIEHMDIFGFQLVEGRLWEAKQDRWTHYKMIVNETAKKTFDIKDITKEHLQPERRLWWSSVHEEDMSKNPPYEIIGVIKDFKTNHLSKATVPLIITYGEKPSSKDPVILKIREGKQQEALKYLQELHHELMGEGNFEYTVLEDEIEALYKEDKQVAIIYITFAIIAIIISCLGLYGLSLFDINQRYREIALRKVNGANMKDIMLLLGRKYTYILVVSFVISLPLSYLVILKYLEGFAHKAPVSWWLFVASALIVALISYATLLLHIRRAMRINPAEVLKGE